MRRARRQRGARALLFLLQREEERGGLWQDGILASCPQLPCEQGVEATQGLSLVKGLEGNARLS